MEIQHIAGQSVMLQTASAKIGFWKRQFGPTVTRPQIFFDVSLGVIAPILCFVFDPIVFKSWFLGPPLFPDYQIVAYLFSGLQIGLLSLWLLTGPGPHLLNCFIGGMFLAASAFCLIAGLVLAPLSLIGLVYAIGAFGFTPFLTGLVYLRNGVRAVRAGSTGPLCFSDGMVPASGMLLVIALPLLLSSQIHAVVSRAVTEI